MNILYLCPRKYYDTKMSRAARFHTFNGIKRLCREQGHFAEYYGNGWSGYNDQKSVQWNIEQLTPKPDVVLAYKPLEHIDPRGVKVPLVLNYNEMWDEEWTTKEIQESGCSIVICHHWNDWEKYRNLGLEGIDFFHIQHCVEISTMHPYRTENRQTHDVIISGVQSKEIYPVRHEMLKALESCNLNISKKFRKHPGYRLKSSAACELQYQQYADDLRQSNVSLCCTSKYKYTLAKLIESMACGCTLVTDKPEDPLFNRFEYFNADDRNYQELIEGAVQFSKTPAANEAAMHNFSIIRRHNSTDAYAVQFFGAMEKHLENTGS